MDIWCGKKFFRLRPRWPGLKIRTGLLCIKAQAFYKGSRKEAVRILRNKETQEFVVDRNGQVQDKRQGLWKNKASKR